VPISHPQRLVPGLTFGIQEAQAQRLVRELRDDRKVDLVVLLSHNGLPADVKMAGRVRGIDVVLGGHTHEGLPEPLRVGKTLVVNSGAHGKFLSRLDLDVRGGAVAGTRYKLIPVLSKALPEDPEMARLIREIRAPHETRLAERLAVSESLLYRRGHFNGSFDEILLDALRKQLDAPIALSPGFRWGITVVPGQAITLEDVYAHTAITYPNTLVRELSGAEIHRIMEDVADNLFHPDPYYRQGGDMLRVGGLTYVIDPRQAIGRRISEIRVDGAPLGPGRRYKVASWASVGPEAPGPPAPEVLAQHLREVRRVKIDAPARVKVVGLT
jgi:sulfur-oxidizing protein SoxB